MAVQKRYPQAILATALLPWTDDDVLDEGMFREDLYCLHILLQVCKIPSSTSLVVDN